MAVVSKDYDIPVIRPLLDDGIISLFVIKLTCVLIVQMRMYDIKRNRIRHRIIPELKLLTLMLLMLS